MDLHEENLSELAAEAREHVESLDQNTHGLDWYVVGGAVRDALMDREYEDLDFVVVGSSPSEMMERGFRDIQASSFPVFMDDEGDEWALARTENKRGDGYHGFEVETEDVTLLDDLRRRDLTINAMALDTMNVLVGERDWTEGDFVHEIGDEFLVDMFNGREHLRREQLSPATTAFKEDPVRVLRLARYASRFGFDPSVEAIQQSREIAYELNRCSRERVGLEVKKAMLQAEEPRRFWEVLRDTGALAVIFPELDRATLVPAGPEAFHMESFLGEEELRREWDG